MKKQLLFWGLILLSSCTDSAVEKPENLIGKDEMIDILYDITLLQAADNANTAKFSQEGIKINEFIYKKYNIDSVTLAQSNRYYASNPGKYKKMFGEVYYRIELKEKEMVKKTGKAIAPSDAPSIQ